MKSLVAVEFCTHFVILMVLPFPLPLPPFVIGSSVILIESTNVGISLNIAVNFLIVVPVFINSVTSD